MFRQIYPVKNNKIVIQLPRHLSISRAEVIVLPVMDSDSGEMEKEDGGTTVLVDFLNMDISHYTPEQKQAYLRTCQMLQQPIDENAPRVAGLFAGLGHISDDFDDPLADEDLFWGAGTDAYGIKE